MSDENNRDIADLFANSAPRNNDAEFVTRINAKLARRRRSILGIRIALILAILVIVAPLLPALLNSLLRAIGLSTL